MAWVMSHTSEKAPTRYNWFIGAIKVAEIQYYKHRGAKPWILRAGGVQPTEHATMSEAMKKIHEHLNSPPPEEAVV